MVKGRWQRGIAFVQGINIYMAKRARREGLLRLCKQAEDARVKLLGVVRSDNMIFKKRGIHHASVGRRLNACFQGTSGRGYMSLLGASRP